VTPDGQVVVSGGIDGTVRVWERTSGQQRAALTGHTGVVRAVTMTADGQTLVSAGDDRTVRVWNLATGAVVTRFYWDFPITSCAASSLASIIVVGDSDGHVLFFTLEGLADPPA
jgi:WD40 repeat protein